MGKYFHPTLDLVSNYLAVLGWMLNNISERGPWMYENLTCHVSDQATLLTCRGWSITCLAFKQGTIHLINQWWAYLQKYTEASIPKRIGHHCKTNSETHIFGIRKKDGQISSGACRSRNMDYESDFLDSPHLYGQECSRKQRIHWPHGISWRRDDGLRMKPLLSFICVNSIPDSYWIGHCHKTIKICNHRCVYISVYVM